MAGNFAYLNTRDLEFIIQEWFPTEKYSTMTATKNTIPKMT